MNKFVCSSCNFPITGVRFSSLEHLDKNLCQKCVNNDTSNFYVRVPDEIKASSCPLLQKRNSLKHSGIGCNLCNTMNITGIRYVCVTCCINICEQCEFKGKHDLTHNRLKIYHPSAHKLAANTHVSYQPPKNNFFNEITKNPFKRDNQEFLLNKPKGSLFDPPPNSSLFFNQPPKDNFFDLPPKDSFFEPKEDGLFNNIKWKFNDNKM